MNILIAGYYGFGNLGDELILSSIITQLKERYGSPTLTVLSATPKATTDAHRIQSVSRWNLFSIAKELWRNDFLILGGGGLIQNKTSQRSLYYYLGLIALARLMHSPVVLYALGVETLEGTFSKWLVKVLLSGKTLTITVRDEASKKILSGIGVPADSITITADPVFSRSMDLMPRARYGFPSSSALLIPRFPCPNSGRRLFAILGRIFRDDRRMKVSGLLFQPMMEKQFLESFNGESILSEGDFKSGLSIDEMAAQIGQHDLIVSARFHGLVLAALAGRPFIGVGDPHKVGRLCESLKMPFLPWEAAEEEIIDAVDRVLMKNSEMNQNLIDHLREAANQTTNHVH